MSVRLEPYKFLIIISYLDHGLQEIIPLEDISC